jgi:hypothetical protein
MTIILLIIIDKHILSNLIILAWHAHFQTHLSCD